MGGSVLIIGSGGVATVAAKKCCDYSSIFSRICIASHNLEACENIRKSLEHADTEIDVRYLDANDEDKVLDLMMELRPDVVLNLTLPYYNLNIMDACVKCRCSYIDTACCEVPEVSKFEYKEQWDYHTAFEESGIVGVLGCGFDPGVTNSFVSYAIRNLFDEVLTVDILDCNAGDHGLPFATNYNAEINIREITAKGKYWDGEWKFTEPLSYSGLFNYPDIGDKLSYLMYHDELESLHKNYPEIKRIRFFMTFTEQYLMHLRCLENTGMTSVTPIVFNGVEVVPLQFLTAVLPKATNIGNRQRGKTSIGCLISGLVDGYERNCFIYNNCDHESCYGETGMGAVAYTAGVPPVVAAKMILEKKWNMTGVHNVEEFNPKPFLDELQLAGLPWHILYDVHEFL